ncbi:MAG: ABC transporter ATP-binding protein [Candidatus Zophobacter franzmannii]|jgi:ABC-type multidrug transport system ATPase subunit|nr:ABC transporter ATP-binding protein [Candidatus Zophobacter franzmannii]
MQPFIKADEITKTYGQTLALDRVSFEVNQNEIFGFIGPDGAGKSTLFQIMTTLLIPDSGSGSINELDIAKNYKEIRSIIGYMPGRFSLYQDLTVAENLKFYANIFGTTIKANYELIKNIYDLLEPFSKRKAGDLSGGMKQKLALCCALIHQPKALFLDEPTTGVDPVSRTEFWDNLTQIKHLGIPIVVSTPYMDEAIRCDRVALIHKGRILKMDTPQKIIAEFSATVLSLSNIDKHQAREAIKNLEGIESIFAFGDSLHITVSKDNSSIIDNLRSTLSSIIPDYKLSEITPDFEDCFLQLMKEEQNV